MTVREELARRVCQHLALPTSVPVPLRLHPYASHPRPAWTAPRLGPPRPGPSDTGPTRTAAVPDPDGEPADLQATLVDLGPRFLTIAPGLPTLIPVLAEDLPATSESLNLTENPRIATELEQMAYAHARLTQELRLAAQEGVVTADPTDRATLSHLTTLDDLWQLALLVDAPAIPARYLPGHLADLARRALAALEYSPPRPRVWHTPLRPEHAARALLATRVRAVLAAGLRTAGRQPPDRM